MFVPPPKKLARYFASQWSVCFSAISVWISALLRVKKRFTRIGPHSRVRRCPRPPWGSGGGRLRCAYLRIESAAKVGVKRRRSRILLDHSLRLSCRSRDSAGPQFVHSNPTSERRRSRAGHDAPGICPRFLLQPCFTIDKGVIGQNVCMGGACFPVLTGEFRDS